jgi:hypothetical protein
MSEGRCRHLTFEERERIAAWRLEGVSQAEMGGGWGRSSSSIIASGTQPAAVGRLLAELRGRVRIWLVASGRRCSRGTSSSSASWSIG